MGAENLSTDKSALGLASRDESYYVPNLPPQVVVMLSSAQEISAIMKTANRGRIPVTARGAGISIACNPVPLLAGILVNMQRFDKMIQIRPEDFVVVVEAGMGCKDLNKALEQHDLFFPPDPGASLQLMREIEALLERQRILNPGKIPP